ncbi:MAG: cytochrome c [Gammaproteobacteria bacterium]|nr:cytochrome c [Gammaproteobacteria bacterium]
MKKQLITAFIALTISSLAQADDIAAGEAAYASKGCIGCHGAAGNSTLPDTAKLNGQHALYLTNALNAYKNGGRNHPVMTAMAAGLSDDEIKQISAYLAAQ